MEIDKPSTVVNESIRRQVDKCVDCPKLPVNTALGEVPEELRRLAALNTVMSKIIQTIRLN